MSLSAQTQKQTEPLHALEVRAFQIKKELQRRLERNKIGRYYPDKGPFRREFYEKHVKFFLLGLRNQFRGVIAANRVGKTEGCGGYEVVKHLTGDYPAWWPGRLFERANRWWIAGDTAKTVRDILQKKLLGQWGEFGTGLIPADSIVRWTPKAGTPEAVDTVWVRHKHGGVSPLVFKSYDQGWRTFQGDEQDGIWLDEESDELTRAECVKRLMTTDGLLIETFTPLKGLTKLVLNYMPNGYEDGMTEVVAEGKALVMIGWDDVPHLTEEAKRKTLAETPPHLRDAVSKGIPSLGAGAIYPVQEAEFVIPDMAIPPHWPRGYALDVGWNRTAALWGALNRDTDELVLYAEHYRGAAEPAVHAAAILGRGKWIPGVIDPAARGRGQDDGKQLLKQYRDLGLDLLESENALESGIYDVWMRLSTGRLKVMQSLRNWLAEYRMYRRDEKGRIVEGNDHLMDTTRYLVLSGLKRFKVEPAGRGSTIQPWRPLDAGVGM